LGGADQVVEVDETAQGRTATAPKRKDLDVKQHGGWAHRNVVATLVDRRGSARCSIVQANRTRAACSGWRWCIPSAGNGRDIGSALRWRDVLEKARGKLGVKFDVDIVHTALIFMISYVQRIHEMAYIRGETRTHTKKWSRIMALRAEHARPRRMGARRSKPKTQAKKRTASSNVINLRADQVTRALIDRAAHALGQNRTEFMLMSARLHAQEVILNQVYFELDEDDWKALNDTLESPPPPNEALKRLMARTPSWSE
jgi:uncharacterized protein (DUF1778 family)